ncbi:GNAT family N-acetyltransferase [Nocardioides sp. CER19]|uniref:GNAT family N-acetyltransferase n=1 Tax=Nocardioides sp. CER19 TaxID=3038538 RepID=UPI00244B0CE9|nr:GNAT family N-acetyltransferase [Nocardioides sp. CER19]MDH2414180.1 GNAT family N-acetyltransferase [Nocardioides sp. CER19]
MRPRRGLLLRDGTDAGEWDDLVRGHPDGTPFHQWDFVTVLSDVLGLPARMAVAEVDGRAVGVVPLLLRFRRPVVLVNQDLPIPYLGPLLPPDVGLPEVLTAVRGFLRPHPVLLFEVRSRRPFPVPSRWGWKRIDGYTSAVVPIAEQDDEDLIGTLSYSRRQQLRRALRNGLTTDSATRQEIAERMTAWANAPFLRQGEPARWPAGAHLAFYDRLAPTGACIATAVRRDETLVSLSLDLVAHDRIYGWEVGLGEDGRAAGAMLAIQWSLMRRARDLGLRELDTLGAPNPGIENYKRSLGAEFRPRGVARWRSPVVALGKRLARPAGLVLTGGADGHRE